MSGLLGNIIASFVIKQPTLSDWRKLFIPFLIFHFIGGIVFLLYGSAKPLKWATFSHSNESNDHDKDILLMNNTQSKTTEKL